MTTIMQAGMQTGTQWFRRPIKQKHTSLSVASASGTPMSWLAILQQVAGAADVRMAGASSSDDDDDSELFGSDSEDEEASTAAAADAAAAAAAAGPAPHERLDGVTGAPQPLTPSLATLSLLPRSKWENLLHLDLIKARNRPLQPPKKPEAAPFFLPTVPGLEGRPVFDPTATAAAQQQGTQQGAAKQGKRQADDDADDDWGISSDDEGEGGVGGSGAATAATAAAAGGQSRVVRSKGSGPGPGTFLRLLRAGGYVLFARSRLSSCCLLAFVGVLSCSLTMRLYRWQLLKHRRAPPLGSGPGNRRLQSALQSVLQWHAGLQVNIRAELQLPQLQRVQSHSSMCIAGSMRQPHSSSLCGHLHVCAAGSDAGNHSSFMTHACTPMLVLQGLMQAITAASWRI